jgi:hypothetical protein
MRSTDRQHPWRKVARSPWTTLELPWPISTRQQNAPLPLCKCHPTLHRNLWTASLRTFEDSAVSITARIHSPEQHWRWWTTPPEAAVQHEPCSKTGNVMFIPLKIDEIRIKTRQSPCSLWMMTMLKANQRAGGLNTKRIAARRSPRNDWSPFGSK